MKRNATGSNPGTTDDLQRRVRALEHQIDELLKFFFIMGGGELDDPEPAPSGRPLRLVRPQ